MEVLVNTFLQLLQISVIASIIGVTILFIKKCLYKFISPKIMYMMWGIFLIALVMPPFIESRTSIYNYVDISNIENFNFDKSEEIQLNMSSEGFEKIEPTNAESSTSIINSEIIQPKKLNINFDIQSTMAIIWLSGVLILLFVYIVSNIIFRVKVGKIIFEDKRIQNILEVAKKKIKVKRNIILINQNLVKTPAIVGIFKPKIILTENIRIYTDLEIEYIFRHELSHYKRKDNVINSILIILRTIHWFNPIVWLIMKEIRKDMELIADEKAIRDLDLSQRKEYCKLLVGLTSNYSTSFMTKAIGITDAKNNLEKRIHMIKLTDKISKHPVFATGLVFIMIGLICLILYTNNYYLPELEFPPKLYLEDENGKMIEMALVEYNWFYNGEFKTSDIKFNQNDYEFKKENTVFTVTSAFSDMMQYSVYTEPKYRINYILQTNYNEYSDSSIYRKNFSVGYDVYGENYKSKRNPILMTGDITEMIVHFPNKSTAKYAVRNMRFETFYEADVFDKYANISLTDVTKINDLIKYMELDGFLKKINVEDNILYLHYDYAQNIRVIPDMCLVLFTNIPELEKVVYTSNQPKIQQEEDNQWERLEYDASNSLEITREIASKYGSVTLEELQMILNER